MWLYVVTQDTRFPYVGARYVEVIAASEHEALSLMPDAYPKAAPTHVRVDRSASADEVAQGPHVKCWW